MTKQSGLTSAFYVATADLSGDIGSLGSMALTRAVQDVSGLQAEGTERIGLRSDGEMSYNAFWNTAAGAVVPTVRTLPTTAVISTYSSGLALGSYAASLVAIRTSFNAARGQDGSLAVTGQVQGSAGYPVEWGQLLTIGKQTYAATQAISAWVVNHAYVLNDLVVPTVANGHYYKATTGGTSAPVTEPTFPTNGTTVADGPNTLIWTDQGLLPNGIDHTASSSFGLAAYLHAFSIGSGTATLTLQDSANRIAWTNITGGAFTGVSAATSQRIQTGFTATVRRYVRVNVTGVFTNLVAVVNVVIYRALQE